MPFGPLVLIIPDRYLGTSRYYQPLGKISRKSPRIKMDTYYCRHTWKMDVNKDFQHQLWEAGKVFLHFPHDKNLKLPDRDNASLNPDDYGRGGKQALKAMIMLASSGGYICSEHHDFPEPKLGFVEPGTPIEIVWNTWGERCGMPNRPAVLKTLQLRKIHSVKPSQALTFLVARPRMGTFMRWPQVQNAIQKGRRKGSRLNLQQFLHGGHFSSKIAINLQTFLEAFDGDAYGGISDATGGFAQFR
jgi:hypothetical protein